MSQASVREGDAHALRTPGHNIPQAREGRQTHGHLHTSCCVSQKLLSKTRTLKPLQKEKHKSFFEVRETIVARPVVVWIIVDS